MKRYLFLDIDGVIAGDAEWGIMLGDHSCPFNVPAIRALTHVFEEVPDLQLVISSTWRKGETVGSLQELFKQRHFIYYYRIIDKTPVIELERQPDVPYMGCPRGIEIEAWLKGHTDNIDQYKYVILDDDSDMMYWQRDNFVHIPYNRVFNTEDALKCIEILK
jgi:hypothetical protein